MSTYEIKRASDAQKLESIYEATAHGRWAHRASLVVEVDPDAGELPDALLEEAGRFGLGLYVMRRHEDGSFKIDQLVEPTPTKSPRSESVNDLLDYYLGRNPGLREEYRRAIGR